ncbi:hypothetical protein CP8484711_1881B, partial [Chlamydia psittaci 84-8471/1]
LSSIISACKRVFSSPSRASPGTLRD